MKIVVLVKQVPDSSLDRHLSTDDFTVDRASASNVINEIDEHAIEAALKLVEEHGGDITLLTVGPDHATESIRKALSMGPDAAVHVVDDAIAGSCAVSTSKVLAAALKDQEYDLVLCGAESTDGGVQSMPHMLSARLGVAALTGAREMSIDGDKVLVERQTEDGYEKLAAAKPAIVSVWDSMNQPRYPSLKGIMSAKRKPIEVKSLSDIGVDASEVGAGAATSQVVDAQPRPPREAGVRVTDEGEGGTELANYLASQKFV
ncbi:MAG TPA: electron transfer flavoprotein subunit beta/FixA family protein [Candidatus Stackebrandtia faecavium]|nr:electron transfer flavoprotein subunit beta/FixA family protein [Candidatus Stackebrandtia faecavium]